MSDAVKAIPLLVRLLALSVLIETLLFRIFARGGVYFIDEETPWLMTTGYTSLVFLGNVLFNFAAPVALLVLALTAVNLWRQRGGLAYGALGAATAAVAMIGALLMVGLSGQALSFAYFADSTGVVLAIAAVAARRSIGWPAMVFVAATGASYISLYAYKGYGLANGTGAWSAGFYGYGEWLAVGGILALGMSLRGYLDRRSAVLAGLIAMMALGMLLGRADSVPLIATWAFGLSLSLPYPVYVLALWVIAAMSLSAIRRDEPVLAAGFALVLLGHRALPLTYFNDVGLVGLLLVALNARPIVNRASARALFRISGSGEIAGRRF